MFTVWVCRYILSHTCSHYASLGLTEHSLDNLIHLILTIIIILFQVLVNGKPAGPQTFDNGISIKSNDGQVTVDGAGSFELSYNKDFDLYSFRMNGWYYGKVSGLFGTYDNEHSNDLMTSYGKQISNSDRFASSWDVGTARCR